jgi:serralysin
MMAKQYGKSKVNGSGMNEDDNINSFSLFFSYPQQRDTSNAPELFLGHTAFHKHVDLSPSITNAALTSPPTVSIGPNIREVSDASATTSTAYSLSVGQSAQGVVSTGGDRDYYKVSLVAGQTYTFAEIGTGVNALKDTYLNLRNAAGKVLAFNNDSGPGQSSLLTYTVKTSGNYFIDVGANSRTATGEYGLSVTAGTKASFNIEMGAGALDSYTSWSPITSASATTITYGFRSSAPTSYAGPTNFSVLSENQMIAVKSILSLWSDVANVKFNQVIDTTVNGLTQYSNNATIEIANYSSTTDGAGAFAYYPGSRLASSASGDLWLNLSGGVTTAGVNPGSYAYFAIMHELGHALGLAHPGDYNAGTGGAITYAASSQFIQDSQQYTSMSYFGGSYTGETPGGFGSAYTPMLFDIYEIQQMYGANTTTRTADNVYGFNSNAGAQYDFTTVSIPQFCIWDAGGKDTLDCSLYSGSQTISLTAGSFSSTTGAINNVSIALGSVVENAIGGAGNDNLIGNNISNILTGGAGADHFIFNTALNASINVDRITDFVAGTDKIGLSKTIMSGLGAIGALSIDEFFQGSASHDATDRILYDAANGSVYYDADGTGAAAAIAIAVIGTSSYPSLNFSDFNILG